MYVIVLHDKNSEEVLGAVSFGGKLIGVEMNQTAIWNLVWRTWHDFYQKKEHDDFINIGEYVDFHNNCQIYQIQEVIMDKIQL